MSYLDKVTVGGTTYDIKDSDALPVGSVGESINIYDINSVEWEDGTISNDDGTNASNNVYKRTVGYIPIDTAQRTLYGYLTTAAVLAVRWYDGSGTFISGQVMYNTASGAKDITIPAGAARLRMAITKARAGDPITLAYSEVTGQIAYKAAWRTIGALPDTAITSNVETNRGSASKAYAIGEYFLLGGVLLKATKAIAIGDKISFDFPSGNNCARTTVMDVIANALSGQ